MFNQESQEEKTNGQKRNIAEVNYNIGGIKLHKQDKVKQDKHNFVDIITSAKVLNERESKVVRLQIDGCEGAVLRKGYAENERFIEDWSKEDWYVHIPQCVMCNILGISERTLRRHLRRIEKKLGGAFTYIKEMGTRKHRMFCRVDYFKLMALADQYRINGDSSNNGDGMKPLIEGMKRAAYAMGLFNTGLGPHFKKPLGTVEDYKLCHALINYLYKKNGNSLEKAIAKIKEYIALVNSSAYMLKELGKRGIKWLLSFYVVEQVFRGRFGVRLVVVKDVIKYSFKSEEKLEKDAKEDIESVQEEEASKAYRRALKKEVGAKRYLSWFSSKNVGIGIRIEGERRKIEMKARSTFISDKIKIKYRDQVVKAAKIYSDLYVGEVYIDGEAIISRGDGGTYMKLNNSFEEGSKYSECNLKKWYGT
jgi:hypothetical protein